MASNPRKIHFWAKKWVSHELILLLDFCFRNAVRYRSSHICVTYDAILCGQAQLYAGIHFLPGKLGTGGELETEPGTEAVRGPNTGVRLREAGIRQG